MNKQGNELTNKVFIKVWDYTTEVVAYKGVAIIAIDKRLSEVEKILDLHWALERLEDL